ncbi:MAG: L,D-transpeptidase family protein [Steroidobacteraceae bacterium]
MRESVIGALLVLVVVCPLTSWAAQKADLVVVKKSESRLYLKRGGQTLESFRVAFGASPKGHKEREGDERTPEGRYVLDSKNAQSAFYKSIHISYPNVQDLAKAKSKGVPPGGLIMIHGQKNGLAWLAPVSQLFNWTDGCIALKNKDMDVVWSAVDAGTPIEIYQ